MQFLWNGDLEINNNSNYYNVEIRHSMSITCENIDHSVFQSLSHEQNRWKYTSKIAQVTMYIENQQFP